MASEDIKNITDSLTSTNIEDNKKSKKEKKQKEEKENKENKEKETIEEVRSAPILDTHENGQFGDLKMIQSKYKTERVWYELKQVEPSNVNKDVWIRARIHSVRAKGIYLTILYLLTTICQAFSNVSPPSMIGCRLVVRSFFSF